MILIVQLMAKQKSPLYRHCLCLGCFLLLSVDIDPEVADRPSRHHLIEVGFYELHGYRLGVVGKAI